MLFDMVPFVCYDSVFDSDPHHTEKVNENDQRYIHNQYGSCNEPVLRIGRQVTENDQKVVSYKKGALV